VENLAVSRISHPMRPLSMVALFRNTCITILESAVIRGVGGGVVGGGGGGGGEGGGGGWGKGGWGGGGGGVGVGGWGGRGGGGGGGETSALPHGGMPRSSLVIVSAR